MPQTKPDAFNHAVHTANIWLADVASALGTRDRRFAQRVLRTWLWVLRDRLTVDTSVKFAQQLPELLRGAYYDGWEPGRVPIKYNVDQYVARFAEEAMIPSAQVAATAAAVTDVIESHMSPGQLGEALAELPTNLRATISEGTTVTPAAAPVAASDGRRDTVEDRINALTEAVRTLAHGLETGPPMESGPDPARVTRAARLADEILISAGARASS